MMPWRRAPGTTPRAGRGATSRINVLGLRPASVPTAYEPVGICVPISKEALAHSCVSIVEFGRPLRADLVRDQGIGPDALSRFQVKIDPSHKRSLVVDIDQLAGEEKAIVRIGCQPMHVVPMVRDA